MTDTAMSPRRPAMRMQQVDLWSRQSVINNRLAWAALTVLALTPLPFGSTPPFFMGVWATAIGVVAIIYAAALNRAGEKFRYGVQYVWPEALMLLLLCGYLVLQALPLGQLFPDLAGLFQIHVPDGEIVQLQTISVAPGDTWHNLLRYGTYGVLFFLTLQVATNTRRRELVLRILLAIITGYALYGLISLYQLGDTILGLPKTSYEGLATGPFINRNTFGTFLAFGVVLALSMTVGHFVQEAAEYPGERTRRQLDPAVLLYALALAVIAVTLLLTQSRMAAFAALCGIVLVAALNLWRSPSPWLTALILGPIGLIGAGGAVYVYGQGLVERLGGVEQSLQVRLALYEQIVAMIQARPWLGFGGGSFGQAYQLFHEPPVDTNLIWDKAHNTYLGLWSEMGVVFGSLPILIVAFLTVRILFGLQNVRSDWVAKVTAAGVVVVAAIHSLADFSLEIPAVAMLFTVILAVGTSGIAIRNGDR
jgi:O-antigen ligase